ncbi:MAG: CHAP domain-containing protein [Bacteroidales bacterium]
MNKYKLLIFIVFGLFFFSISINMVLKNYNFTKAYKIGQVVDSMNNVMIYYNGSVEHITGRNLTKDNYNLGLKYQCVEFIKRYYFQHLKHKMPVSSGNAIDYFDKELRDGEKNCQRNLIQYKNSSKSKPAVDDIIVFSGSFFNKFGHVAIVSNVSEDEIEIIQQNPGKYAKSRKIFTLKHTDDLWKIDNKHVLGWLRKVNK